MYLMKGIFNIFIFFINPSAGLTTLSCITPYEIIDLDIDAVSNSFQYTAIGTSNISPSCAWLFQSSDPTMTIFVSNVNLDCTVARVAFFDGPSANASSIEGAICCPNCSGAAALNQLFVDLYTFEATNATAMDFQMTVLIGKDKSRCTTNGFVNYVQLTNDVTLTSPNFPSLYPINFVCYYNYEHFTSRIKVTFSYLDLEDVYDYVEIYDGKSTLKLQGTTIPEKPFLSEGQHLSLKFFSDYSVRKHGFKALISSLITKLSCITPYEIIDLDIDAVSNSFQYTAIGTSNISPSCAWLFQSSDPTMTIFVSNVNFDCAVGGVNFFDGPSANASSIEGAICCPDCSGAAGAAAVNQLFVDLYTHEATNATAMNFQMTVLIGKDESRCTTNGFGNDVNLRNDVTLTSPNFPSLYPINFVCYYNYTHFSGRIKVTFSYLDLEDEYDYVEIYDGNSTLKLQGTTIPEKPFLSDGQKITLKFYSDFSVRKHGFKALISPFDNIITESTTIQTLKTSLVKSSDKTITEQSSSISLAFIVAIAFAAGAFCFSFFIVFFVIFKMKRLSSENRNIPNACYEGPMSATKPDDYEIPVTRHHVENVYDEIPLDDIIASSRL